MQSEAHTVILILFFVVILISFVVSLGLYLREKGRRKFLENENTSLRDKIHLAIDGFHDGKGLINPLSGYLRMLQKEDLSKDILEIVNYAQEVTRKMTDFLEDATRWAGEGKWNPEYFVPNFNEVAQLFKEMADSREVKIEFGEIYPFRVFGDEKMFDAILRNLISNAISYSPYGETVQIFTGKRGKELVVSISNKITSDEDALQGGTGIGLKIVETFVERNGGRMWNEKVSGEITFFFTIPCDR